MSMIKIMNLVLAAILICGVSVFSSCTKQDNPVNPADNLAERILGKWMPAEWDGEPTLTNRKMVITFVSSTKAKMSISLNSHPEVGTPWDEEIEADVDIDGNKVTVSFHRNEHHTAVHEYIITSINGWEFTANHKVTSTVDGEVVFFVEDIVRYEKITADYRETVLGTWEGHVTNSEGSEFDDGETHRWEYKADGTYVYYVKDGDNWVPGDNTLNEYFVDGNLLCTRWIDQGQENREWWEIVSIKNDVMKWKGLRQKEDGSTFTATFEMKKVE